MKPVIAIDFGTSNCLMAFYERGEIKLIPAEDGSFYTPSVVAISGDHKFLVGASARAQAILNPSGTISNLKRRLGTGEKITLGGAEYASQELAARIFLKLKNDAQKYLGETIEGVVITVPANFSDAERKAVMQSGEIAGLRVLRIINEPTAAALGMDVDPLQESNVLIYDFGGGTVDVSLLELMEGVYEVKATAGSNEIGGVDFDKIIYDLLLEAVPTQFQSLVKNDPTAVQKILEEAEKAKILLSVEKKVSVVIPFLSASESGPIHLDTTITRAQFEDKAGEWIERSIEIVRDCIQSSKIDGKIDHVFLVGGSSQIPLVKKRMSEMFECDVTTPAEPREVVVKGAAIECAILSGQIKGKTLVDVTPLSLGIEIDNGLFSPIIPRNTPIPVSAKRLFTTLTDYQKSVEIKVLQGERKRASDNILLGNFLLEPIRPVKKGEPRIEVQFDVNIDGIIHVEAVDLDTGKNQKIHITDSLGLSDVEIKRMLLRAKSDK